MFHVELAPLGGILGPLKSDLGVFWAKIPLYPYNVKFSNSIFSKSANLPILSFWILNVHIIICQFQKRSTVKHFLSLTPCSCHLWARIQFWGVLNVSLCTSSGTQLGWWQKTCCDDFLLQTGTFSWFTKLLRKWWFFVTHTFSSPRGGPNWPDLQTC